MKKIKKKNPSWRNFEIQVSNIEAALLNSNASIKSPDFLLDVDTGNMREVDALIRHNVGSTSLLIAFECRKRNSPQDVMWIEQLIAKKQSLKLDKLIAVSSKGFTSFAIQKAEKHGIELRQISQMEVASLDILRKNINMAAFKFPTLLGGMSIRIGTDQIPKEIATKQFHENLEKFGLKMTFGYNYSNNAPHSLQAFVQQICNTNFQQLIELRKKFSTINLVLKFSEPQYYYLVQTLQYPIKEVHLQLNIQDGIIPIQIDLASTYKKLDEKFATVFHTDELQLDTETTTNLTVVVTKNSVHSHAAFNTFQNK